MDEELLINLVKEHGELYDSEHKQYEDQHKREAAWQEIAKRANQTAQECRDRWKRLRDNYRKARKLRQTKKAQGFKKIKPIKYEKIFAFIDSIIDNRERTDPTELADEDSESASSTNIDKFVEVTQNAVPEYERNNEESTENNTLVNFFANLGETVNTFPPDVQIRVKRDIFKIINEAEEEVLTNRLNIREVRRVSRQDVNVKFESSEFDSHF
ncbi:transcription factor Adf-1-like isoform X2 [Cydia strobilella]